VATTIHLGEIAIAVTKKHIKHAHLSVHPPNGRVTLAVPKRTRPEVARAYAVTRLGWIRQKQQQLRGQARETLRHFIERETHYLWGRRYLFSIREEAAKPSVKLSHRRIMLSVRPRTNLTGPGARQLCTRGTSRYCMPQCLTYPQMGASPRGIGGRLLPATHEDQVG
jgi:predicted metal-dependent hydrolase